MSIFGKLLQENDIPSIDYSVLEFAQEMGLSLEELSNLDEAVLELPKSIKNAKLNMEDIKDIKNQWKKVAEKFTMHKWIYRYIKDEKQEVMLHKYHDIICQDDVNYQEYRKAYKFFCQFFGIPTNGTIIEWIEFGNNKEDKEMKQIAVRYSKGIAKVNIPEGMKLVHTSPANDIKQLIPSFKSKTKGKFFYPNKRVYFTVQKNIDPFKYGVDKKIKLTQYTPANKILTAYIDPTYAIFKERSVYVETDSPINVVKFDKKSAGLFRRDE